MFLDPFFVTVVSFVLSPIATFAISLNSWNKQQT
jgi:hypothetical protein